MNDIVGALIESLRDGNIFPAIAIAVFALVMNFKKVYEFLEERKRARIAKIMDALKCGHVSGLTRVHLEEQLATEQFQISTGIRLEKEVREALIRAH